MLRFFGLNVKTLSEPFPWTVKPYLFMVVWFQLVPTYIRIGLVKQTYCCCKVARAYPSSCIIVFSQTETTVSSGGVSQLCSLASWKR